MSWARLDDAMPDHPKIVTAGALAELVQYRAICYAMRYLTDGFIPEAALPRLCLGLDRIFDGPPEELASRLVRACLWHRCRGGWRIHSFLDYNPSRETVEIGQARNRERQRRFRESNAVTNGHVTLPPTPTPTPTPKNTDKISSVGQARRQVALEILDFLNRKTGRHYQPTKANLSMIEARLAEGATLLQCRAIIGRKTREWSMDEKMIQYLRPATLFNATKFSQYQGELPSTAFQEAP